MGRGELAKPMSGRNIDLAQAAARQGLAVPDASKLEDLFSAARALETPARTVLAGYSGEPPERPASDIDCHVESDQIRSQQDCLS
jgi:hypothetical protein